MSEKNKSGQLIEQLAVLHQEIEPKPNSAATFQSFLVSEKWYQFRIPKTTEKDIIKQLWNHGTQGEKNKFI